MRAPGTGCGDYTGSAELVESASLHAGSVRAHAANVSSEHLEDFVELCQLFREASHQALDVLQLTQLLRHLLPALVVRSRSGGNAVEQQLVFHGIELRSAILDPLAETLRELRRYTAAFEIASNPLPAGGCLVALRCLQGASDPFPTHPLFPRFGSTPIRSCWKEQEWCHSTAARGFAAKPSPWQGKVDLHREGITPLRRARGR